MNYSFDDETAAALSATTLYYRLRQRDIDGKEQATAGLEVYPNPTATSTGVWRRTWESEAASLAVCNTHETLLRQISITESTL
jgi:hypothetical protein